MLDLRQGPDPVGIGHADVEDVGVALAAHRRHQAVRCGRRPAGTGGGGEHDAADEPEEQHERQSPPPVAPQLGAES